MKLFFELSFQEWRAKNAYAAPIAQALAAWRAHAAQRLAEVKANRHWHDGVPCATAITCHRFAAGASTEAAE